MCETVKKRFFRQKIIAIIRGAQLVCHDDPYVMLEYLRKKGLHA